MVLGKKAAIFDWEWGRNSAPREGQKIPCVFITYLHVCIAGMRTVRHSQSRKGVGWILNGAIQIFRSLIKSLN